ncbi:MAG: RNA degradosome polyphosphate kinase [Bacteroidia bacterium]|nr:RNA degradosome polyphosphate kinase [Bacteroidia bacterium]
MTKNNITKHYVERDVSWMYFNHRILNEAGKDNVPLLERLSFLGIYSNNLDEFFRVRVASLSRTVDNSSLDKATSHSLKNCLKAINRLNEEYSKEYDEALHKLRHLLKEKGVDLVDEQNLSDAQKQFLIDLFYDKLNGLVNPIWLANIDDICSLEDNSIHLLVEKKEIQTGKSKYAIVKVPDKQVGRWITLPSDNNRSVIIYLDDVVRFCLPLIFLGFKESSYKAYSFKFTKDAEMEIGNDQDYSTLERIAVGVDSRKKGDAVRVIYDKAMPKQMKKKIIERLGMTELDTSLAGGRYQNHKDLMSFPSCGMTDEKYEKWAPIMKPVFLQPESLLDSIREHDQFIHVPYHSFDGYIRLLREAAIKPEVKSIKTTLYRLAKDSKVVKALISAARNGKKVTAVVELLARFDEESNIKWSKRMQKEGINVIFGVEGLKVHSKLLHIESTKGNIACIGTGNFHEGNAKVYTDYLMMTSRSKIVNEVAKVFDFIDKPYIKPRFSELLVSPSAMKTRILRMIDTEIRFAKAHKEAWIKIKINHITDMDMINKLYEASRAGVKIDILVRGNCSLMTGIKGVSDNIRCVGIIDRYLEHSRILIFCNGGHNRFFIGSADWMPRNLVNRVEVMSPVYDEGMCADLMRTIDYGLDDTSNGHIVTGTGADHLQKPLDEQSAFRSQEELYKYYKNEQS